MIASFFLLYLKSVLTCGGGNDIINSGGVMKNKKFSFVKWLTNRDIEKILAPLNIEIMKKKNSDKLRIIRGDGAITVFCKDNNPNEEKDMRDSIMREMMQHPTFRGFMSRILTVNALVSSMNPESSFSQYDNTLILRFEDYCLIESMSLKSEEKQIEFDRKLTKHYQEYMSKKFGRFYNGMKAAALKKSYKEAREEEAKNKEAEQTKEDSEETMEK